MEEYKSYTNAWRQKRRAEREVLPLLRQQLLEIAQKCARLLAEKYAVRTVYLFGSVAWPDRFHADSDIDLAVEGLPDEKYTRALAELWRLLPPGHELNLVPIEAAFPELAERIRREGMVLYAA
ncbi:MAG: nucleotidyltransferase domain-containing protein [candidate division KSB1 bacterium]|nr:nucleotidyltransferase domain-containing protein [candidate division KSB1 bacterium]MDZ7303453.1 nucleotidyltransferase domain-containing protein [candidate division KSB1 bacterium]MDZ7312535.1 nucleotidyltransferase domain-containing protein [candidate division KSB1 bacterium]